MLQRSPNAFSAVLSLVFHFCFVLALPCTASAAILTLGNGLKPISELHIGDDLVVELADARGGYEYRALLIDDQGGVVAKTILLTNSLGQAESILWQRGGVIGCQNSSFVDPAKSLFFDYAQAELELDGRVFHVRVVDPISGRAVLSRSLPLRATTEPRYYFSDAAGCPVVAVFVGEPLFISGLHVPTAAVAGLPLGNLFVTDSFDHLLNGTPAVDLRGLPDGQQLAIPLHGDPILEEILEVREPPQCIYGTIHPPILPDPDPDPEPEGGSGGSGGGGSGGSGSNGSSGSGGPLEPLGFLAPIRGLAGPCSADKPWFCPPCTAY